MELILAASAALAVAFLVLALQPLSGDRRARERVASMRDQTRFGLPVPETPESVDVMGRFAGRIERVAPTMLTRRAQDLLGRAGLRWRAERVVSTWLAAVTLLAGAAALWWLMVSPDPSPRQAVPIVLVPALLAASPWVALRRKAQQRSRQVSRSLPQALDLIVTNIEGGLGLQAALLMVARKVSGPIGEEFARATAEISVGVPRDRALLAMAERTGSDDVQAVARAIAQAERSGISIAQLLRARAVEMRERRRLSAREQANKVPVKMTIPVVLFIFPTFFLLLLTPVALNAADVMSK